MKSMKVVYGAIVVGLLVSCGPSGPAWTDVVKGPELNITEAVDSNRATGELLTGLYLVVDQPNPFALHTTKPMDTVLYLNPEPIVTRADFDQVRMLQPQEAGNMNAMLQVRLDSDGTERFRVATAENIGRLIAVVFRNELIMAPVVSNEISGGVLYIEGGDNDEKMEVIYHVLTRP